MSRKVLCLGGGGVRIYGAIGALFEAEKQGFDFSQFDLITATSAGCIPGMMLAADKTPTQMIELAMNFPLSKFIDKGFIGEKVLFNGISNKGLGDWADSLKVIPSNRLLMNTLDITTNQQKIFYKEDYEKHGYGYAVRCTTCLPFAMSPIDDKYLDGGIVENPLSLLLDPEDQILFIHLGYAGEARSSEKRGLLENIDILKRTSDMMYAFDYKNHMQFKYMIDKFPNADVIYPKVFNIRSSNFWISDKQKLQMIEDGGKNTKDQWAAIKNKWS